MAEWSNSENGGVWIQQDHNKNKTILPARTGTIKETTSQKDQVI